MLQGIGRSVNRLTRDLLVLKMRIPKSKTAALRFKLGFGYWATARSGEKIFELGRHVTLIMPETAG